jgi:hypothetical protein
VGIFVQSGGTSIYISDLVASFYAFRGKLLQNFTFEGFWKKSFEVCGKSLGGFRK